VERPLQPIVGGRRGLILLVLVLGGVCTLGPFATDLYLPALPTVADDLHAGAHTIQLTVTTFLVGLALGQLLVGPLSDSVGRRRPLLAGLGVFAVASLVCAAAPSAGVLIGVRAVQGIAGASGVAIANAVVTDHFRGRESARLLSRLVLVSGMAPIVAPLVGGQLLRVTSWRGVFLVLAALGVLLCVGVGFGLRESLPRERRVSGSLAGTLRVMGRLSRDSVFMGLTLSGGLMYAAFFGYLAASSFVVQDIYGASPVMFSVLFSINAVGMLLASQLNHLLLARFAPRVLLAAGLIACVIAGMSLLGVSLVGGLGLLALAVPLFLLVSATGFAGPDATALALSLHPDVAGSASAYFGTLRLGLAAAATPLVGLGSGVSAMPLAILVAVASVGALVAFLAVARKVGGAGPTEPVPLTAPEAADDLAVG
jgi:MFS transporter, DHA1 family, multidrug resistance protein